MVNYYGKTFPLFSLALFIPGAIFIGQGKEAKQTGGNMRKFHSCLNGEVIEGDTYWKKDGYGIPLALVCPKCVKEKMSRFRSDIEGRYDTDEDIEDIW